jgi:hypothetical protein
MIDFEKLLQDEINKLPYEKHADDGRYNDGRQAGFELGARWLYNLIKTDQSEKLKIQKGETEATSD